MNSVCYVCAVLLFLCVCVHLVPGPGEDPV